jgi:hypothetical protein
MEETLAVEMLHTALGNRGTLVDLDGTQVRIHVERVG